MDMVMDKTGLLQICIDACSKCAQTCYECFNACLSEPDLNARKDCVSILVECAMVCQMTVSIMSMNGLFSKEQCELCEKICNKCAEECAMFKDEYCKKCADICLTCAQACQNMTHSQYSVI
ncbi:four-helix bundle copper-binding protein [Cellulosilyticum sp. I15G10I2]|uniref:four-helix bundle copper-binding protein n=1 Tax=Cellulosilyticum sp. I15G10I2 TaxID=1892843 RepID=UPI00085CA48E|nr:four-helix bundle copper-binding protein [Cellulosilyticum sp. I15G10I2]